MERSAIVSPKLFPARAYSIYTLLHTRTHEAGSPQSFLRIRDQQIRARAACSPSKETAGRVTRRQTMDSAQMKREVVVALARGTLYAPPRAGPPKRANARGEARTHRLPTGAAWPRYRKVTRPFGGRARQQSFAAARPAPHTPAATAATAATAAAARSRRRSAFL